MAWGETLWQKRERERLLAEQFPELQDNSPDKVMQVDNYRSNNGGFVSEFSQRVMRLAKHAAEVAEQSQAGAPIEVQTAADRKRAGLPDFGGKRAGVPRGVAEAFPEEAEGRRVYGREGSLDEPGRLVADAINVANTPGRVGLGIVSALGPPGKGEFPLQDIPRNTWLALTDPTSFRGVDTGLAQKFPDTGLEAGPLNLTPRTVAGFGIEMFTDPTNLIGGSAAGIGSKPLVREGAQEALERASRTALRPATAGGSPISEILDSVIPGQKLDNALLQRYEGRVNTAALAIKRDMDRGNEMLAATKIGKPTGTSRAVPRTDEMVQLYKVLHGELPPESVPLRLKPIYDDLKEQVALETQLSVDFDPKFMPHPDYFPRGWKAPKETKPGASRMGAKPGFKKARVDATFSEMLDDGWEPRSWNPYEMLAERRLAGVQYREQTDLVRYLQDAGVAVKAKGIIPEGYRVPRVGPAFEGKPKIIPGAEEGALPQFAGYTDQWAVPDRTADVLENAYGTPVRLAVAGKNIMPAIDWLGQTSKRAKLFGSLFQQVDFSTRTGWFTFGGAVDSLTRGHPIEAVAKVISVPAEIGKLAYANTSGARRAALRDQILDTKPIFKERPGITLRGISEAGWRTNDITLINRGLREAIQSIDTPRNLPAAALSGVTRNFDRLEQSMQRGLFDGVYPQAQITVLRNNVVPAIVRAHPDWTDAQVMASAAAEINKMFSTLGNFQTIFSGRGMRALTRNLIFSTNEPEALIRQGLSTVSGPNKRLWAENWIGGALFLGAMANVIHYAATGEELPLDRLSPVTLEKGDGPLGLDFDPIPFGYNSKFLAPDIPGLKGRNSTKVAVDLMGQMDTIFRVLDPNAFLTSRFSTPLRTVANQFKGEDFYGRPFENPKERIAQAISDLVAPIGAGNVMGALGIGPENEGRIGDIGQLVQATGLNLRGETNVELRDRIASEYAQQQGIEGVSTLDELAEKLNLTRTNAEKRVREVFPEFDAELDTRRAERAESDPETQQRIELDEKRAVSRAEQEADDERVTSGEITWDQWKENRARRLDEIRGFSEAVYGDEAIAEPKNAYEEWINVVRENKTLDGIEWDAVDAWVSQQDETRQKFIADNTGLYGTKLEKERRAVADRLDEKGYFDIRDRVWTKVAARMEGMEGFKSVEDFRNDVSKRIRERLKARGIDPASPTADILVNDIIEKLPAIEVWTKVSNDVEEAWITAYPDLAAEALKYGYISPGSLRGDEKSVIIGAGTR